jgi:uncharacterized protein (TIGR00369 family)
VVSDGVHAPETSAHLQRIRGFVTGDLPAPPIARLIGYVGVHAELGHVIAELEVDGKHMNQMGTVAGGVICDLADATMGPAMATTLADEESFTTIDLATKFLKPVRTGRLRAAAHVIKRTRTLGLIECIVTDEAGSLVAKAVSTCMVLRGRSAEGR